MPGARVRLVGLAALVVAPVALQAQARDSSAAGAIVRVQVRHEGAPVTAARVRAGGVSLSTNAQGVAVLTLAPGSHTLHATRLGYAPASMTVQLRAGGDTSVVIQLQPHEARLEAVVVRATRGERRIEDTPLRVEVLGREEVEEKMLMTPGDITMMLNETGGLRVQTTSPSLGGANVRVQGLRGRYTLLLSDGLPLFGGQSGTLGLLQIPPMDLAQVEVVKGVASALYGTAALGGVINLVTRRPRDEPERELLFNATTRNGSDAIGWASRQLTERWGYTLLASGHRQTRVDVDGDGWTDVPGYERGVVRPRVFWRGPNGGSGMLTLGSTIEDRRGGTIGAAVAPDGAAYAEALRTRRLDGGGVVFVPFGSSVLSARASVSSQEHRHQFGAARERDDHATWFGEVSLATTRENGMTVVGVAIQRERYAGADVTRFDYTHSIPSAFAQVDVELGRRFLVSASGRADAHSQYGPLFNPRLSVLYRLAPAWTVRLSGGTGAFAPTPFTEETEATGLTPLLALPSLEVERARSASLDVGRALGRIEVNATVFASRIEHALMVLRTAVASTLLEIANASEPTRAVGADGVFRLRVSGWTTTASYTFVHSTEQTPGGTGRRRAPLTPRHSAGLTSVWEREGVGRVGVEYYYTGTQPLDENPYRTASRPYSVFGAIAERRFGRMRAFVNLENLGNVRLDNFQSLVRPSRGQGGRWTTDAWAPLEGRVINGGVRVDFGGAN